MGARVKHDQVTILVNRAHTKDSVDPKRAKKSLKEATDRLNTAVGELDKAEASLFLRALAQFIRFLNKYFIIFSIKKLFNFHFIEILNIYVEILWSTSSSCSPSFFSSSWDTTIFYS